MTNHPCVSERTYKIPTPGSPLFPNTSCLGRVRAILLYPTPNPPLTTRRCGSAPLSDLQLSNLHYWGRDEKIGKKDQQDDLGSEVARKALWKKNRAWQTSESLMMVWEESYSASLYRSLNLTIYCTSRYGGYDTKQTYPTTLCNNWGLRCFAI